MAESKFLNERIVKRTLPALTPPTAPGAPVLKRLLLPQGELAQFWDGEQPINYIAYIELRPGTVRGNHYHKIKEEHVYVMQGELTLLLEDVQTHDRDSVPLKGGELVTIPTFVAHALRVSANGSAVEFSPARFDPVDTYKFAISDR